MKPKQMPERVGQAFARDIYSRALEGKAQPQGIKRKQRTPEMALAVWNARASR
jgi:hypothetical protein